MSARLGEADLEIVRASPREPVLARQLKQVHAAEQLVVLEQSPLSRELAQALLLRKHNRPGLKVVVLTDLAEATAAARSELITLERNGVIVARVRTENLRDPNLLYAGVWRLAFGWGSSVFDEAGDSAAARARRLTYRADERQLLASDDGAGSWLTCFGAPDGELAVVVHGAPAHDILASQLSIAGWSIDDERLPVAPPASQRRVGSIDARFLSEGGIGAALADTVRSAVRGDALSLEAHALAERALIEALAGAAERGAHVQLLLDSLEAPNAAIAGELQRAGVALRFRAQTTARYSLLLLRHGTDLAAYFTSAALTRRALGRFQSGKRSRAAAAGADRRGALAAGAVRCAVPCGAGGHRDQRGAVR